VQNPHLHLEGERVQGNRWTIRQPPRLRARGRRGWGAGAGRAPHVCVRGDEGGRGRALLHWHSHPAFACERGRIVACPARALGVGRPGAVAHSRRFRVRGRGGRGTAATHGRGHVQGQLACTKATERAGASPEVLMRPVELDCWARQPG
jgi:hypothetical protein